MAAPLLLRNAHLRKLCDIKVPSCLSAPAILPAQGGPSTAPPTESDRDRCARSATTRPMHGRVASHFHAGRHLRGEVVMWEAMLTYQQDTTTSGIRSVEKSLD